MKRNATAVWEGTGKEGKGNLTTQSTVLNKTQYSFNSRFAEGVGTNPEELIAAAHAGCFSMSLSATLSQEGFTAGDIFTTATIDLDTQTLSIVGIHLKLKASLIDGVDESKFIEIAEGAKKNCIVSKALSVPITLDTTYA